MKKILDVFLGEIYVYPAKTEQIMSFDITRRKILPAGNIRFVNIVCRKSHGLEQNAYV